MGYKQEVITQTKPFYTKGQFSDDGQISTSNLAYEVMIRVFYNFSENFVAYHLKGLESMVQDYRHRSLYRQIDSDVNKSTADQLEMQIRKLALGLWLISLHRYLWLKKLALVDLC